MANPRFWAGPIRYMRWAAQEHTAVFWATVMGCAGPVILLAKKPTWSYMGWESRPKIPTTYPSKPLSRPSSSDAN
jgi:hypothetical protein